MVKLTISPSTHRYQPGICISIGHASVPGRVRECGTCLLCLQSSRKDSSRIWEDRVQVQATHLIWMDFMVSSLVSSFFASMLHAMCRDHPGDAAEI